MFGSDSGVPPSQVHMFTLLWWGQFNVITKVVCTFPTIHTTDYANVFNYDDLTMLLTNNTDSNRAKKNTVH